jgi:hypothetical protein
MPLSTNLPSVYIRTRIPKTYQKQPIVSRLISRYDLTVNIAAALLGNYDQVLRRVQAPKFYLWGQAVGGFNRLQTSFCN